MVTRFVLREKKAKLHTSGSLGVQFLPAVSSDSSEVVDCDDKDG